MPIARFRHAGKLHFGFVEADSAVSLGVLGHHLPDSVCDIVARWDEFNRLNPHATYSVDEVELLAPMPSPRKVICVGRNYADHAEEMDSVVDELPVVFNKFPSCVIGPNENIILPSISKRVDYEGELVVVIGQPASQVDQSLALDHVFGYCCGNDVTARDWQKEAPGGQWLLGKSFDSFAPIGPWIVAAPDIDPFHLDIQLRINQQVMQSANTRQMIFTIPYLISHISKFTTLQPGDLIFTGTPAGVGAGRHPPRFLSDGDQIEIEISGIGVLRNQVVASR